MALFQSGSKSPDETVFNYELRIINYELFERYNVTLSETSDEFTAEQAAWEAVHQQFDEDENGVWSKSKVNV